MKRAALVLILIFLPGPALALELTDREIASLQAECSDMPVGERIAFWAEKFVGTPYDPDPLGIYVTKQVIVADKMVDCMYLTFRAAELALSNSPASAVEAALSMRFQKKGILEHGEVMNYDERFQYAMDMLLSGKWGTDITPTLPGATGMKGSRGVDRVSYLPAGAIPGAMGHLRSGDIVYFVKDPSKRMVGEIVGHIGIIKREGKREDITENETLYLIHASGHKNHGGEVKKVLFGDYVRDMPFAGIMVGRF
jgi:hypothetical protein